MATAIIVAAGQGLRMRAEVRKQYLPLNDAPIIVHTLRVFEKIAAIAAMVLVVPASDVPFCRQMTGEDADPSFNTPIQVVAGGDSRQESVCRGLCAAAPEDDNHLVAIHDGVRPFVEPAQVIRCINAAGRFGASILGVPAQDTLKKTDGDGNITETLPRERLWHAQTPQVFRYGLIRGAHEAAMTAGVAVTDDAALVERLGARVVVVEGSRKNIKITTPEDLDFARHFLGAGRARGNRK